MSKGREKREKNARGGVTEKRKNKKELT